ncbi:Uu.00g033580.m01.CDS01 [Anthostomella pinea]|uniref:Uu.00g033580.m01.CDS01 n=1 Tax=Anthostomella pinea TaxID=933095 RepID=A0AAI8YD92_9PEZI|nr:Uu.00g033580.m01.CDS01 [Anthostomella pinea]
MSQDNEDNGPTCPKSHSKPPAYTGDLEQARPELKPRHYAARDLLNHTVGSFHELSDRKLSHIQLEAKKKFLKAYKSHARLTTSKLHQKNLLRILNDLMAHIDDFFFFGALRKSSTASVRLTISLTGAYPGLVGYCEYLNDENGIPQSHITIARRYEGSLRNLPQLVITLLHEMIHAFLWSYARRIDKCLRNIVNTVGADGSLHGPTFGAFDFATMNCISQWDSQLDEYLTKENFGKFVGFLDQPALAREVEEPEAAKARGELTGYRPLIKKASRRHLIQITDEKVYIDT